MSVNIPRNTYSGPNTIGTQDNENKLAIFQLAQCFGAMSRNDCPDAKAYISGDIEATFGYEKIGQLIGKSGSEVIGLLNVDNKYTSFQEITKTIEALTLAVSARLTVRFDLRNQNHDARH